jgi:hypothetical protein
MASNSSLCGHPLKTRPGQTCMNRASHYIEGGRYCGKHINFLVGKKAPSGAPSGTPSAPPAFIPFDCGICLDECKSARGVCTTICNHKFHKTCLLKWEKSSRKVYNCPLCRKKLPRTIKRQTPSTNDEREEFREQLELIMSTLRSRDNREGSATAAHLENLINHAGIDAVARATDRIVRELSNRIQREREMRLVG